MIDDLNKLDADDIRNDLLERARKMYAEKDEMFTPEELSNIERVVLLRNVDSNWVNHIDAMEDLQDSVGLQAYAQKDPVTVYRTEAADMFDEMVESIRQDTAKMLVAAQIRTNNGETLQRKRVAKVTGTSGGGDNSIKKQPVRAGKKIGRNDPCPCGSGKKYKKCCGKNQ